MKTMLIAGFGDLGLAIAKQAQADPGYKNLSILALRRNPPQPTNLLKPNESTNSELPPNVTWLAADLADRASIAAVLATHTQIDSVVYCAAPNERTEQAYRSTYVTGLQNLVGVLDDLDIKHTGGAPQKPYSQEPYPQKPYPQRPRILFVSSTAVYDSQAQGVFDETSPTEPRGFNGKVLCEAEAWLLSNWPEATVLRLSGIYGPTKQRLLQSIKEGQSTTPDSEDYIANRIHLDDAARAVLHLLKGKHSGIFLGTDSHPIPLRALYETLADLLGAPAPGIAAPSPMMGKKQLSNQKLLRTGFELKWPDCIEGYKAMIASRDQI
ncbi:MAG TPA: sugar nucleotide-binding protein [Orrella sp.]